MYIVVVSIAAKETQLKRRVMHLVCLLTPPVYYINCKILNYSNAIKSEMLLGVAEK